MHNSFQQLYPAKYGLQPEDYDSVLENIWNSGKNIIQMTDISTEKKHNSNT